MSGRPDIASCQAIVQLLQHPDFVNSGAVGFPNDIAYIQWSTLIAEVAGKIQYIAMAQTADQNDGRVCYITGWGRLDGEYRSRGKVRFPSHCNF